MNSTVAKIERNCFRNLKFRFNTRVAPGWNSTIRKMTSTGNDKMTPDSAVVWDCSSRAAGVASFKVMDVLRRANEIERIQKQPVLHCEIGQPSTGAPATVKAAAVQALQDSTQVMGYTDAFGLLPLRQKIIDHYRQTYKLIDDNSIDDWVPSAAQVVVTTGSSAGFLLTFTAAFDAGDVVAIASVGYPCYRNILGAVGCQLQHIPVNAEFKLTATELRAEIAGRKQENLLPIKGLILSSPSNPTGTMLSAAELHDLCTLCDSEGIRFISDEIYHGISYGKQQEVSALQYSKEVIVINSFSKYYSSKWLCASTRKRLFLLRACPPDIPFFQPIFSNSVWLAIGLDGGT
jgi:aspartate/methionine/tyrosine aminotransferase